MKREEAHSRLEQILRRTSRGLSISAAESRILVDRGYAVLVNKVPTLTQHGQEVARAHATNEIDRTSDPRALHLGEILRWYRQRSRQPLTEILRRARISRSGLYAYEKGARKLSALTLIDLAGAMGLNLTELSVAMADEPADERMSGLVMRGVPVGPRTKAAYVEAGWGYLTEWGTLALTEEGIAAIRQRQRETSRYPAGQAVA